LAFAAGNGILPLGGACQHPLHYGFPDPRQLAVVMGADCLARALRAARHPDARMAAVSRDQPTSWRAVLSLVPVMRIASMTSRDVVPSAYKKCSIDRGCDDCGQRYSRASRTMSVAILSMAAAMPRATSGRGRTAAQRALWVAR
jgi:hypothetical protein